MQIKWMKGYSSIFYCELNSLTRDVTCSKLQRDGELLKLY